MASWEDKEKMGSNDEENIFNDKFKEDEKNNDIFKIFDKDKGEKEDVPDTECFSH